MPADEWRKTARLTHLTPPSPTDTPPRLVDVQVAFGAAARPAPGRATPDDHHLVLRLGRHLETLITSLPGSHRFQSFDEFGYGMVVADGIGSSGEVASRLAIAALVQLVLDFGKWHVRVNEPIADEMINRAERYFRSVDAALRTSATGEASDLQTALTATYSAGNDLFFMHVGHSRAYLFRDDHLMQLTHDQTLARRGGATTTLSVAASGQDQHHVVTGTLGAAAAGASRIDVERCGLLDGDDILLCTNGLTDVVDDAQIAAVLRANRVPDDAGRALVDLAVRSGTADDVTAVVAHYRIKARPE